MNPRSRVLIVDDHPINAALVDAFFRKAGWATDVVHEGQAALAAVDRQTYDLVLLDISMPGMSGIEVCAHIRAHPVASGVRVVAYTAHALPEEHDTLRVGGFDDILTKPVSRATVNAMLQRVGFAAL
jgi:CheY-like chemotaxis protein